MKNPLQFICPLGYFCDSLIEKTPCPSGTYGNGTGGTGLEVCAPCPRGYYCEEGTAGYPTHAILCPKGHVCPEGTQAAYQHPCPDGTYNDQLGQDNSTKCKQCPIGRYCTGGDGDGGVLCPRGHYCPSGTRSASQHPCPAGYFTEEQGTEEMSQCKVCPAGYYCPAGVDAPIPCNEGFYNPHLGSPTNYSCRLCIGGMACPSKGLTEPLESCAAGHYCPEGTVLADDQRHQCPAGTYSDFHNLTASHQCTPCPAGQACLQGTGGINNPPFPCAVGHYCPLKTARPDQYPCSAGSYTNQTNLQKQEDCEVCPKGYFCVAGQDQPSGLCNKGHFCPPGTQLGTDFPCPAGTYSPSLGNVRVENCTICPEGHYCAAGSPEPTLCLNGTYSSALGAKYASDCVICPGGYECPQRGMTEPVECGFGYFSDGNAIHCTICSAGYYCDNRITHRTDMHRNKICPAGMTCKEGRTNPPNLLADACIVGHYCLDGDVDPLPRQCPNGTFSSLTGLKSVTECERCPSGKYCSPPGLTKPVSTSFLFCRY